LSAADIVATITQLTVESIAAAYRDFAPAPIGEVILAGGGQHNAAIVEGLRGRLAPVPVITHEDIGIASDYKEALLFALLAHETWHNRPGTLPALTGARHASVLGSITPGENYIGPDPPHLGEPMTIWVGIDGGGTNLRVAVVNAELVVLGEARRGTANPSTIGREAAAALVQETLAEALQQAGKSPEDVAGVGVGIAGASADHSEDWLREIIGTALPRSAYRAQFG
jgi:activator of 2-hydroxyglutaryl-CoA dehydratase